MKIEICFSILFSLLLIAACAPGTSPAVQPDTITAPIVLKGAITLLLNEGSEELVGYQQLVDAFSQAQPGVKVTISNISDSSQFLKRLAADFAAKTPPDVFVINYRRFGQFAIKATLEPVDTYMARSKTIKPGDFYPAALDAFKFKGRQYCIPQNLSSLVVYYNKKLFASANVPFPKAGWTWNDFLQAARALTKSTKGDGKIDQYGLGTSTASIRLAPFIWAHGGELVDDPTRPTRLTIDSGVALEAFQWFVNLQVKEHVVPSKIDEATESSQSRFQHGTLAMFLQSRAVTPEFRATIKDFDWDVASLPGDKTIATILHSDGYCIASESKNKDAAWALVEFANGPDGQKTIVTSGRTIPSLKSVAESPLFLDTGKPPTNNKIFLDTAPNIRRVPIMTTWIEVEDVLDKEIKRAFYGDTSVEDAARSAVNNTLEFFRQNLIDLGS